MGLFKKKIDMSYKPAFKTKALQEQYDELKETYEKLKDKYDSVIKQHMNDKYDYIQMKQAVDEKRELILQLQSKIYALQEELIAKNRIIQGMDNANQ